MKIIVGRDYKAVSRSAAGIFLRQLKKKPGSVIGLPSGDSPLGLYKGLVEAHRKRGADFSKAYFFGLDEYLGLKASNKNSYHYYFFKNFFSKVNASPKKIFLLNGTAMNPEKECASFESKLSCRGIDLVFLGIGINDHIGFDEPGTSFNSKTHIAELSQQTIRKNSVFFSSAKKVPRRALTVGIGTILSAKKIALLASGKEKAKAVAAAIEGAVTEKLPASALQKHKNSTFILDKGAASLLSKPRKH